MAKISEGVVYESSTISSSQYDYKSKILLVVFHSGTTYMYKGIDVETYEKFATADSQGKALNEYIKKGNFAFSQVN